MKQIKSNTIIVLFHLVVTAIIFPFFGLSVGYFVLKFLGTSLNSGALIILKDVISIGFFFLGVRYSLSYIDKNMIVQNPKSCSKNSIMFFAILIIYIWSIHISNNANNISFIYNTLFFGVLLLIFIIMTHQYFINLSKQDSQKVS